MKERIRAAVAKLPSRQESPHGYLIAFLLMMFALSIRFLMAPVDAGLQYVAFFPAVTLSVFIAGFWPGIFATALGLLFATAIFTFPYYAFSVEALRNSFWSNILFLADGLVVCFSIEAMHRYRFRYARELDESKTAHAETRRHSQHLKNIFDNVLDGIITIDETGRVESFNQSAEKIFRYDATEVIGRSVSMLMPDDYHHDDYLKHYLSTGEKKIIGIGREVWGKRKDGSVFAMELSVCEIKDDSCTFFTGIVRDISERKADEERLHHMAHHDQLTGLPNRALFSDRLHLVIAKARRNREKAALMFIDLDKFKPINDRLGHDTGDLLLKEAALRLQHCLRESDTAARIGGDEFVVLLPAIETEQGAMQVAKKIGQALEQPFELNGHRIDITSSIGVAVYPDHGSEEKSLIKNADTAMYHAKKTEGGSVQLYHQEML